MMMCWQLCVEQLDGDGAICWLLWDVLVSG
jgi:hypothetical protein